MLKYILAIASIVFSWVAVHVLKLPPWMGALASAIPVLVVAMILLVRKLRARAAAKKLEQAIAVQGDAHANAVRPEQQADIVALKGEFLKAVGALKGSRLGKGGMTALYALPWYVIIGPPGAGKSTALRASGLQFPYLSAQGGAVRGIGGTRNCDWWLTNEAILLDTAGRYTTDDEDRDEWFAFLDLLKRNRTKQPINGVLIAVSVADLTRANDAELDRLASRVRERVDEITERLGIVPPIYMLFTKCDLIEGFEDTFGDLKKADRGQIWGFTLPIGTGQLPLDALLAERFAEIESSVRKRALRRLGQERRTDAREKIYGFPQQFALLRPQIETFMGLLFTPNIYKEPPLVRGVYFTSGTQEGRPIDRVMNAMADAFGVAPQLPVQAPVVEQKSYFLRDMFMNVVFPDRTIAAKTRFAAISQRRRGLVIGAAIFGVSLLFATLPAWSFVQNRLLISSTAQVVGDVAKHRSSGKGAVTLAQLEPLRARAELLRKYEVDSPPPALRFGLYHGDLLYPHVKALYSDVLKKDVLEPIVNNLGAQLEDYARAPDDGTYDPAHYERFKLYLLLTGPGKDEPAVEGKLRDWAVQRIVTAWATLLGSEPVAEMNGYVSLYFDLARSDPSLGLPRDNALVQRLRVVLADVPLERVLIDPLVADMSAQGYDMTLEKILGGPNSVLRSNKKVRGAFTKEAWNGVFKPRFDDAASILEPWVLGSQGKTEKPEELTARLRTRYFQLYIDEWRTFLEGISIPLVNADVEVLTQLQALTRGVPKPYERIFKAVADHTRLDPPSSEGALLDKAAGAVAKKAGKVGGAALAAGRSALASDSGDNLGPGDVQDYFDPFVRFGVAPPPPPALPGATAPPPPASVQLDAYYEQVIFARDALSGALQNPGELPAVAGKLKGILNEANAMIEQQEVGWRPLFKKLFFTPLKNAENAVKRGKVEGDGLPWCNEVVRNWDPNFKGRYPFATGGHDAALQDVIAFYAPAGIWQGFYDATFASAVQRMGDKFEFIGDPGYSGGLLTFLARSHEITTILFPGGSKVPLVEFEVRIRPSPQVSQITLEIDGTAVKTQNEPDRWHKFKWPGDGKQGASIKVKGAQNLSETIAQEGEWGFFRLLEQGKVEASAASRQFTVTWTLSSRAGVQITFDIKPARGEAPFFGLSRRGSAGKLFTSFRSQVAPPHSIGPGLACHVN